MFSETEYISFLQAIDREQIFYLLKSHHFRMFTIDEFLLIS